MGIERRGEEYELEAKLKSASKYESEGKLLHAVQVYLDLARRYPDVPDSEYRLTTLYERMGNPDAATRLVEDILERRGSEREPRLFAAHYYYKNEMWRETLETLAPISLVDEPTAAFFAGDANHKLGNYEEAERLFVEYVRRERQSPLVKEARQALARLAMRDKRYDEATKHLKEAERLAPDEFTTHKLYAACYYAQDMIRHALDAVLRALKLDADDRSLHELAGTVMLKAGEYERLEALTFKYISTHEASAQIYLNLGLASLRLEKYKEAETYLTTALSIDQSNERAGAALKEVTKLLKEKFADGGR
jgi:tetratricopeptide (TPR) repeat protein